MCEFPASAMHPIELDYSPTFKVISDIDVATRQRMADLYLANYDGSDTGRFYRDLATKDEALLVYNNRQLVGFTTFQSYPRTWKNKPIRVIYSGDTIMHRKHWGQQALSFAWIKRMGEMKRQFPDQLFYWFLLVKGHRTFRYMPTFGKTFYPHWSASRVDLKPLADHLAEEKFGKYYNRSTGVVEFPTSHGHLKQEIANPSTEELTKEAVRYFLDRNPGYKQGHELVCICEMEEFNMKPLTKRLFRSLD